MKKSKNSEYFVKFKNFNFSTLSIFNNSPNNTEIGFRKDRSLSLSNLGPNLYIPTSTIDYHPKNNTNKIKKEITFLERRISEVPLKHFYYGFTNRPIINTNKSEYDFSCKNLIMTSPTNRLLVSSRNYNDKKEKNQDFQRTIVEQKLKKDFFMYNRKKNEDFNNYMKELSVFIKKRQNKLKNEI